MGLNDFSVAYALSHWWFVFIVVVVGSVGAVVNLMMEVCLLFESFNFLYYFLQHFSLNVKLLLLNL